MDQEGLWCTALAEQDAEGVVSARCRLPIPLDLSLTGGLYEISTATVACRPTWLSVGELYLVSTDAEDDYDKLVFADLAVSDQEVSLQLLQEQLLDKFGSKNPKVRLNSQSTGWVLKIKAKSLVQLSPALAELLGLPETLENTESTQRPFRVSFAPRTVPISEQFYLLICENVRMNFCSPKGSQLRVAEFLSFTGPADPNKVTEFHTPSSDHFIRLEGGVVSEIEFKLTDLYGSLIVADKVHFFVLFLIRYRINEHPVQISGML